MSNLIVFDDNSSIEWVDKETLRYKKGGVSTLIWVDFEPGFFSNGRIIRESSIKEWKKPDGEANLVSPEERREIIKKAIKYYDKLGKKCRVET